MKTGLTQLTAGVEIAFTSRTAYVLNLVVCENKNSTLKPVLQKVNISFDECKKELKNVHAFQVIITGKIITAHRLTKYYENHAELTRAIMPDADTSDFHAQAFEVPGFYYGSVIRKDAYKSLIKMFNEAKMYPSNVIIGPYPMAVAPLITGKEDLSLKTTNYHLIFEGKLLALIIPLKESVQPENIQLSNIEINSFCLPALCAAVNAELEYLKIGMTDDPETLKLIDESKQKRKFRKLLYAFVPFIFAVVATNFFLNQHFGTKRNTYDEKMAVNQQKLAEINKLENDIEEKKALLGKRLGNQGPVISILSDQLAATIPSKIKLKNLEIFPIAGKIQKERPMSFSYNKILVEGISSESDVLDAWMQNCQKMEWVKDVLLVKYNYDAEKKGFFKVELILQ